MPFALLLYNRIIVRVLYTLTFADHIIFMICQYFIMVKLFCKMITNQYYTEVVKD